MRRLTCGFLLCSLAFADVGIVDGHATRHVLYLGEVMANGKNAGVIRVILAPCETTEMRRETCNSRPLKAISFDAFSANLNAIYGISASWSGSDALSRMGFRIEDLEKELEEIGDIPENQTAVKARLQQLTKDQRKLIRLQREVYSKLGREHGTVDPHTGIDVNGHQDDQKVLAAFETAWLDSIGRVWRMGSAAALFTEQGSFCFPPFRPVRPSDFESPKDIFREILTSTLRKDLPELRVWTDETNLIDLIDFGGNKKGRHPVATTVNLRLLLIEKGFSPESQSSVYGEFGARDASGNFTEATRIVDKKKLPVLCILDPR